MERRRDRTCYPADDPEAVDFGDDSTKRHAPSVYVVEGIPQSAMIGAWLLWRAGKAPCFALEVVPMGVEDERGDVLEHCREIGIEELIVLDRRPCERLARWRVFRRHGADLVEVELRRRDRERD